MMQRPTTNRSRHRYLDADDDVDSGAWEAVEVEVVEVVEMVVMVKVAPFPAVFVTLTSSIVRCAAARDWSDASASTSSDRRRGSSS